MGVQEGTPSQSTVMGSNRHFWLLQAGPTLPHSHSGQGCASPAPFAPDRGAWSPEAQENLEISRITRPQLPSLVLILLPALSPAGSLMVMMVLLGPPGSHQNFLGLNWPLDLGTALPCCPSPPH